VEELMPLHLALNGTTHSIEILRRKPHLVLSVNGRPYEIPAWSAEPVGDMVIQGSTVAFTRALVDDAGRETCFVRIDGRTHEVVLIDPREEFAGHDASREEIHAPMPGAIISIHKETGEQVTRGETVITIESMKLQTALAAPRDGRLLDILQKGGETFDKDELLARLEPLEEA
jgi:acetyl/propionyl-CoA carboxylase alpha subunit